MSFAREYVPPRVNINAKRQGLDKNPGVRRFKFPSVLSCLLFFFFNVCMYVCIYLFIYGCAGSLLLQAGFLVVIGRASFNTVHRLLILVPSLVASLSRAQA